MLHYSKSAGYAIHALSFLGATPGACLVRDIADSTGLQKPYLAKIINQLAHQGLVKAKRGFHGGIMLAKPPEKISLFQIVEAVERDEHGNDCLFGLEKCPANKRCPAHQHWNSVRARLEDLLRKTTLSSVIKTTSGKRGVRRAA